MLKHKPFFVFLFTLLLASSGCAAEVSQAPLPPEAAIASAHPLATEVGYKILQQGGNAFDAAVAVSAALAVVEPYSSGLGGGGFYLLHRASDGKNIFLDARETAPAAASRDMYLNVADGEVQWDKMRYGGLAAGIPGTPAALVMLARDYGRLSLATSLQPATTLAREGFAVDARLALALHERMDLLQRYCAAPCAFLPGGKPPAVGEILRQPALADTLQTLADHGTAGFYQGALAEKLVAGVREHGGIWTMQDLADYQPVLREPLIGEVNDARIITAPPPSSGGSVILETLNILAGFDLVALDSATRKHLIVEAWRRAYRDRGEYVGDPAFVDVPVDLLTDPRYAAGLRATINLQHATPSRLLPATTTHPEGQHTTHFSILDTQGNRVGATQTINYWFGSGVVPAGTGVTINNEMFDFVPKAGLPDGFGLVSGTVNTVAPGKRPVSSMSPTFVESARGVAILGTPGGSRIISMNTLAMLEYFAGGSAHDMTARPRFHHQYLPDVIQYEQGALTEQEITTLRAMGHELKQTLRRYGNMNVVVWDYEDNKVEAATDPRNEAYVDF